MITLLAFIGFIVILRLAQKALIKISNWCYEASNECLDYVSIMKRREIEENKALQQKNKKTAEIIQDIKGGKPDECSNKICSLYSNIDQGKEVLLYKRGSD